MFNKLLSGLFWVLLLNLIVKPFWIFGIEVGVQNAVGAEMYGFYFAVFNMAYIFNIFLDIGITNFNTRNISQYPDRIRQNVPDMLAVKFVLLAFYLLATFSVGLLCGYGSRQFYFLAWLCVNQFLNSLILYLRSNFEGLFLFKWDSLLSVLDRLVMIVVCGVLLWGPWHSGFQIEWFIYAQTFAYLVTLTVAAVVLFKKVGFVRPRLRWKYAADIISKSLPFALLVLLMASYNRIDPILLQHLSPEGSLQSGIYAGAFRLLDAMTMFAYLISVPLLPVFARLCRNTHLPEAKREIQTTTRVMFSFCTVLLIPVACSLSSMGFPVVDLLYSENVDSMASVFSILVWGIVPITYTYIFGTLLTANGSLATLNVLSLSTLAVNIFINILLIPVWGAMGSAIASLTAQSFVAIAQIWVAVRVFNISVNVNYILKLTLFTLFVILSDLQLEQAYLSGVFPWWMHMAILVTLALLLACLLRLININELYILKNTDR